MCIALETTNIALSFFYHIFPDFIFFLARAIAWKRCGEEILTPNIIFANLTPFYIVSPKPR